MHKGVGTALICLWWRMQSWWRHQMETFSALLALCEENPPVTGGFPHTGQLTRSFDVFFDLRYNKRLSKQSRRRWFETPSRSLWRHYNDMRQWTGSSVVQITACHLFGAKPCLNQWRPVVSWTLRNTLQRNPSQNGKKKPFLWRPCVWKCRQETNGYLSRARDVNQTIAKNRSFNSVYTSLHYRQLIMQS